MSLCYPSICSSVYLSAHDATSHVHSLFSGSVSGCLRIYLCPQHGIDNVRAAALKLVALRATLLTGVALIDYLRHRANVFARLCLFVCLSVC